MALIFGDGPPGYDGEQGLMKWFGEDSGECVECRVTVSALTRDFGAKGFAEAELQRAFKENQEMIEKIAKSKYAIGDVTIEQDSLGQTRTVILIDYAGS